MGGLIYNHGYSIHTEQDALVFLNKESPQKWLVEMNSQRILMSTGPRTHSDSAPEQTFSSQFDEAEAMLDFRCRVVPRDWGVSCAAGTNGGVWLGKPGRAWWSNHPLFAWGKDSFPPIARNTWVARLVLRVPTFLDASNGHREENHEFASSFFGGESLTTRYIHISAMVRPFNLWMVGLLMGNSGFVCRRQAILPLRQFEYPMIEVHDSTGSQYVSPLGK